MGEKLGIEDPEQWLEDCPDRVYERWVAAYRLNPFGDEQFMQARICALLFMLVQRDYKEATWEAMVRITKLFMPPDWIGNQSERVPIKAVDVEALRAAEKVFAAKFG